MKQFYHLLVNTLVATVTTSFLWFAFSFWVYLETKNVMATAYLSGAYMLLMAITGIFFGTLVDKHHKKNVMVVATAVTATMYVLAGIIFILIPQESLLTVGGPWFWLFTLVILAGAIVENIRNIALSTCVTIMVPKDKRANANGAVGAVQGVAYMLTSVFSGLVIGQLGMGWALSLTIALTILAFIDLLFVRIREDHLEHDPNLTQAVDIRGAWLAIRAIPGLLALMLFAAFNNLIGGVFMALLDPYGLTLVNVETWGFVYAFTTVGFIIGGIVVAKRGLGKNPLRLMLLTWIGVSLVGLFLGIRESIWLVTICMLAYMTLMPVTEAAEQTLLQKIVPFKKQGRVFGLGQSLEAGAAPISAFLIGPIAQFALIPYMKSTEGQATWGWLLGSGEARGIALSFIFASLVMLAAAILAFRTRSYRVLIREYNESTQ